ncbi:MAG TPA: MFS transporter [Acetobacteraceae bacterium]|nr:MFS transporter [Acetobacteraceae bacterium]
MTLLRPTAWHNGIAARAGGAALLLGAAWITLFAIGTDLFVISPLIPRIAGDYRIRPADAGLLVTIFAAGYAIAAPLFGHAADRLGRRRVLVWCLCAFSAANLLTSAADDLPQMLMARLACGIAAAGIAPSLYALLGDAAPPGRRATWIAVGVTGLLAALPLGATAGTLLSPILGWRAIFLAMGLAGLALTLLNRLAWPSAPAAGPSHAASAGAFPTLHLIKALLPTVAWSAALYGMYTYLAVGLAASGYTAQQIAETILLYGIAALAGALAGGRIADRLGPQLAVQASLMALAAAFGTMELAVKCGTAITPVVGLVAITAQVFFPAQQARLIETFGNRRAAALSWNNSALFLGMTMGSLLGGPMFGAGGLAAIPVMSAIFAIAGVVLCLSKPQHLPAVSRA